MLRFMELQRVRHDGATELSVSPQALFLTILVIFEPLHFHINFMSSSISTKNLLGF